MAGRCECGNEHGFIKCGEFLDSLLKGVAASLG